jgi:hypothetical protein
VSATFKLSGEPGVNDGHCLLLGHLALANGDHVAVTVFFCQARSPFVPDHCTPNPAEPVGNDGFVPAPTQDDAKGVFALRHGPCRCAHKVRVIYRLGGVGPEIFDLDSFRLNMGLQYPLYANPAWSLAMAILVIISLLPKFELSDLRRFSQYGSYLLADREIAAKSESWKILA